jgi:hypothetical protein
MSAVKAPEMRIMPWSSCQCRKYRSRRRRRCASSASSAANLRVRASWRSPATLLRAARSNKSASEPGTAFSVLAISAAWLSDTSPAISAWAVNGADSRLATSDSAARASESGTPDVWATQAVGSENPRSLWAPYAAARTAATALTAAHRFSTLARDSTTAAQSPPDRRDGFRPDKASPNNSIAAVNSANIRLLLRYVTDQQGRRVISQTHERQ